ncbi:MAG: AAA family ATPase [Rhodobacteraceae bacterium]|nr:AAA family ATPase [Paracoccaceae bacterium]
MIESMQAVWPYPGSRWWKFDFHTHTPASKDTYWARNESSELTCEAWLHRFMAEEIDCLAVTDHNSGEWIDPLKEAYGQMKERARAGAPPNGFRELVIFPGVELSILGGVHMLAVFDPSESTRTITDLLAKVGFTGEDGTCDGATQVSAAQAVQAVLDAGGIPIPAHADQERGLFQVRPNTQQLKLANDIVSQVLDANGLLAVEWTNMESGVPILIEKQFEDFSLVLGSDCHSFVGNRTPGSRFTWIKMAEPSLEGLRLALLDGNDISVRRSDGEEFDHFFTPEHFIARLEVDSARYMGNGDPECLEFNPCYNSLIGGRGTGKSSIVHALRLAYRRNSEIEALPKDSEPHQQFSSFSTRPIARGKPGGLREETEIRLQLVRDGIRHRLRWRANGNESTVEEYNAESGWRPSSSQVISAERFPVRILSQGQLSTLAGANQEGLLRIIDEAAEVGELQIELKETRHRYLSQTARLRELDEALKRKPELERMHSDLHRKIESFRNSRYGSALRAHEKAQMQEHDVDGLLAELQSMPGRIDSLMPDLLLYDWSQGTFDAVQDKDILEWRQEAERILETAVQDIARVAQRLERKIGELSADGRLASWRKRTCKARDNFQELKGSLDGQEVADPMDFVRLLLKRQEVGTQLKDLDVKQHDRSQLEADICETMKRVRETRIAITDKRKEFVENTLAANAFVRVEVDLFGSNAEAVESELRELLDAHNRFQHDFEQLRNDLSGNGTTVESGKAFDREESLRDVKNRLISVDESFGGHFRNFLKRKFEKGPELADYIRCWFPEDKLVVKYSRLGNGSDWRSITQSSQGQRSAALLAFLLAFGDEPLILDQPEDDLDNRLVYDLIVKQIRENKRRRQLIIVTHNPNVVVNGDAEMIHALDFQRGQCRVVAKGALQDGSVREEVCRIMEGGRDALAHRWARLGQTV